MRYECEECGELQTFAGKPDDEKLVCPKCGAPLRFRPALTGRSSAGSRRRNITHGYAPEFPMLKFAIIVFWIAAFALGVTAIVFAHVLAFDGKWAQAIMVGAGGVLTAVGYLAGAEIFRLFMNVEHNSRRSANVLDEIRDRLPPPGEKNEPQA